MRRRGSCWRRRVEVSKRVTTKQQTGAHSPQQKHNKMPPPNERKLGRVLVRASGTEPLLRVMVEASSQEQVDHWTDHLSDLADQLLNA